MQQFPYRLIRSFLLPGCRTTLNGIIDQHHRKILLHSFYLNGHTYTNWIIWGGGFPYPLILVPFFGSSLFALFTIAKCFAVSPPPVHLPPHFLPGSPVPTPLARSALVSRASRLAKQTPVMQVTLYSISTTPLIPNNFSGRCRPLIYSVGDTDNWFPFFPKLCYEKVLRIPMNLSLFLSFFSKSIYSHVNDQIKTRSQICETRTPELKLMPWSCNLWKVTVSWLSKMFFTLSSI